MSFNFHSFSFNNNWIIDIEASQHMTRNLHFFDQPPIQELDHFVTIPSGKVLQVQGVVGTIKLSENLFLKNMFYIPKFKVNLTVIANQPMIMILNQFLMPIHIFFRQANQGM